MLNQFFQEAVNLRRCPVILLRCEGSGDEVVLTTNAIWKASDQVLVRQNVVEALTTLNDAEE